MTRMIALYVAAALVFFPLDMLWLGVVARDLYRSQLGHLLLPQPNWGVAALFYLLYLVGMVVFVMLPANGSVPQALLSGALFGLVAYATYALTNYAPLKGYPPALAVLDMGWGAVLSATTAALGVWLARIVA